MGYIISKLSARMLQRAKKHMESLPPTPYVESHLHKNQWNLLNSELYIAWTKKEGKWFHMSPILPKNIRESCLNISDTEPIQKAVDKSVVIIGDILKNMLECINIGYVYRMFYKLHPEKQLNWETRCATSNDQNPYNKYSKVKKFSILGLFAHSVKKVKFINSTLTN